MKTYAIVLMSAAILGGAVFASVAYWQHQTRYTIQAAGGSGGVYVLDRRTGSIVWCDFGKCDPATKAANPFDALDGQGSFLENPK